MTLSNCDSITIEKGARENLPPFLLTIYYKRGKIKVAKKKVDSTDERIDKPNNKGLFFVRLAYGVVGSYMDTKNMTTQEVIQEFLNRNGVKTPREFFEKRFKGRKKAQAKPKTENGAIVEENKTPESNPHENPRGIKSNVEKAKTTKEAEQIAKEKLGIDADYSGMDVDTANTMNESISITQQFCPQITEQFKSAGVAQKRNKKMKQTLVEYYTQQYIWRGYNEESAEYWAKKSATKSMKGQAVGGLIVAFSWSAKNDFSKEYLSQYQGVFINSAYSKNASQVDADMQYQVKIGFHPEGCGSLKATIDHECGHQIADYLGLAENPEMVSFYIECQQKGEIGKGLSRYATTDINEFIAEGWAEYLNNPNPRPIAKRIGEIIIKANKEKQGK